MHEFDYFRPASLPEASALLAGAEDARILAGGQSLLPIMKQRLAQPSRLIDLGAIPHLREISVSAGVVTIGAMATHRAVATSPEIRAAIPALAEMASMIGDTAVRNRGTIGGSICYNDPAADYPAACLALDATIVTSAREIPPREFFVSPLETDLGPGEIAAAVRFRIPDCAAYEKIRTPASRFAAVGVFIARFGAVYRVALTGASVDGAIRLHDMEQALVDDPSAAAADAIDLDVTEMNSDLFADQEFRLHLVRVAARRAIRSLAQKV